MIDKNENDARLQKNKLGRNFITLDPLSAVQI